MIFNIQLNKIWNFLGIEDVSSTKEGEKIIDEGESHNIIIEKLKEIKAI